MELVLVLTVGTLLERKVLSLAQWGPLNVFLPELLSTQ